MEEYNMRECNKTININKNITVEETANTEEIVSIMENKISKTINIAVEFKNNGNLLLSESYLITGDKYNLLMSENPSFAPSKPQNEYREADLWYIIDLIRQENTAQ
jgi:hypothetical protein